MLAHLPGESRVGKITILGIKRRTNKLEDITNGKGIARLGTDNHGLWRSIVGVDTDSGLGAATLAILDNQLGVESTRLSKDEGGLVLGRINSAIAVKVPLVRDFVAIGIVTASTIECHRKRSKADGIISLDEGLGVAIVGSGVGDAEEAGIALGSGITTGHIIQSLSTLVRAKLQGNNLLGRRECLHGGGKGRDGRVAFGISTLLSAGADSVDATVSVFRIEIGILEVRGPASIVGVESATGAGTTILLVVAVPVDGVVELGRLAGRSLGLAGVAHALPEGEAVVGTLEIVAAGQDALPHVPSYLVDVELSVLDVGVEGEAVRVAKAGGPDLLTLDIGIAGKAVDVAPGRIGAGVGVVGGDGPVLVEADDLADEAVQGLGHGHAGGILLDASTGIADSDVQLPVISEGNVTGIVGGRVQRRGLEEDQLGIRVDLHAAGVNDVAGEAVDRSLVAILLHLGIAIAVLVVVVEEVDPGLGGELRMDADARQTTGPVEAKVVVDVDIEDKLGLDVVGGIELVDGGVEHLALLLGDEKILAVGGEFEVGGRVGQHDELILELSLEILVDVDGGVVGGRKEVVVGKDCRHGQKPRRCERKPSRHHHDLCVICCCARLRLMVLAPHLLGRLSK
mmetsp:Transcript_3630/g.10325  ORF Transcript_3630/g.10325 Transcript_3630/m.10325 type:complete len:626 (-) Transcript_3630:315-2192(-)